MRVLLLSLVFLVATANAETLVVVEKGDNTVRLIDLSSGQTRGLLPAGDGPHEVAVSPDGRRALVTNYGWQVPGNSLTLLDVTTPEVLATFSLGEHLRPHGIAWSGDDVWVTSEAESGALLQVEPVTGAVVAALPSGQSASHMVALHPDGQRAYVSNITSGSVSVFDLVTGQRLQILPTGKGAEGIAVSPDGSELWVANQDDNDIAIYDTASLTERARFHVHGRPMRIAFTPDGARALVTCGRTVDLAVFDAVQRNPITRVRFTHDAAPGWNFGLNPTPIGVLVAPDGRHAYVALAAAREVAEINLDDYRIERTFITGRQPDGLAWSPVTLAAP
jgi:YVTN family beta-propeller protein